MFRMRNITVRQCIYKSQYYWKMKKMKLTLSILILVLISFVLDASTGKKPGYNIQVQISGLQQSDLYLGFHYGNKQFIKDTIQVDDAGRGTFQGEKSLQQGIYLVITPKKKYFEILIGSDQHFSLQTSVKDFVHELEFQGSEINEAFNAYQKFMMRQNQQSAVLKKRLKDIQDHPDSAKIIRNQLKLLDRKVQNKWKTLISEYPNTLLAAVIKGMRNVEVPEFDVPAAVENKDSVRWHKRYQYYKAHFFDNIDLSDPRMVRTPILHKKLDHYFNNILVQQPDSIIPQVDRIISQTKGDDETYRYTVRYLLNHYQQSNIMGMDEVFVHIAEKYYLSGGADWMDEQSLAKLRDRVNKIKPNLIGKKAPELKMRTPSGEYASLKDVDSKYTLLYFWEPGCSHCKTITPKIHSLYNKYSRNQLEVFAVYTQTNKQGWMAYLNKNSFNWINVFDPQYLTNFRQKYDIYSTPTLYLLDEKKKIVAKRIGYETLKKMLEQKIGPPN